jgi:quinol monooxygenase YgiN
MGAYAISSRWLVKDGEQEAVAAALANLLPPSREEPGCLLLLAHRDPEDPRVFYFYEQWADAAAAGAHAETDHFKRYALGEALPRVESRERAFYETWDV